MIFHICLILRALHPKISRGVHVFGTWSHRIQYCQCLLQVLAAVVITSWVYTIMAGYHVSLKVIPAPKKPQQIIQTDWSGNESEYQSEYQSEMEYMY